MAPLRTSLWQLVFRQPLQGPGLYLVTYVTLGAAWLAAAHLSDIWSVLILIGSTAGKGELVLRVWEEERFCQGTLVICEDVAKTSLLSGTPVIKWCLLYDPHTSLRLHQIVWAPSLHPAAIHHSHESQSLLPAQPESQYWRQFSPPAV